MSSPLPIANAQVTADLQEFTLWALESLGVAVSPVDNGVFTGPIPEAQRGQLGDGDSLRITFSSPSADDATLITSDSAFFRALVAKVQDSRGIPSAAPRQQPAGVREVSQRLFEPYQIDDGSVHLSGCTLEDRALLRITYLERPLASDDRPSTGNPTARLVHLFTGLTGEPVEPAVAAGLKLAELRPFDEATHVSPDQLRRWSEAAATTFRSLESPAEEAPAERELLLVTAVWCKFAEGKLSFVIGDSTASIAFSGWAELLANGSLKPPPYTCPLTDKTSYHLTLTADGEIAPTEAVATCSQSGQPFLETQLERCATTGVLALPKYFADCPVTGNRVLESELTTCGMCQQKVSPAAIRSKLCGACRSLQSVSKDDPRMARVLGEFPNLDRWRKWRLAETSSVYVMIASALMKRLLVVVDRDSLEVRRLANSSRFSQRWAEAAEVDRDELLHRDS